MRKPHTLILASCLLIAAMFWLVPFLTSALGPATGYLAVFCIYWFLFCLPLGIFFQGRAAAFEKLQFNLRGNRWIPWAVLIQVALVALATSFLLPYKIQVASVLLGIVFGTLNGFSEELFWRGAFLEQGGGSRRFMALGLVLFTLWHVPLTLAHGVHYEGGAIALVGGAFAVGALWTWIAIRTREIGWPILAHILTNITTFSALLVPALV